MYVAILWDNKNRNEIAAISGPYQTPELAWAEFTEPGLAVSVWPMQSPIETEPVITKTINPYQQSAQD